jgi:hypothetical protein
MVDELQQTLSFRDIFRLCASHRLANRRGIGASMSVGGTKRTWPDVRLESAFGGRAEVEFRGRQVR